MEINETDVRKGNYFTSRQHASKYQNNFSKTTSVLDTLDINTATNWVYLDTRVICWLIHTGGSHLEVKNKK